MSVGVRVNVGVIVGVSLGVGVEVRVNVGVIVGVLLGVGVGVSVTAGRSCGLIGPSNSRAIHPPAYSSSLGSSWLGAIWSQVPSSLRAPKMKHAFFTSNGSPSTAYMLPGPERT